MEWERLEAEVREGEVEKGREVEVALGEEEGGRGGEEGEVPVISWDGNGGRRGDDGLVVEVGGRGGRRRRGRGGRPVEGGGWRGSGDEERPRKELLDDVWQRRIPERQVPQLRERHRKALPCICEFERDDIGEKTVDGIGGASVRAVLGREG